MSGTGASIQWNGLDKLISENANKLTSERKKLLESVGEVIVSSSVDRFKEERSPEGKRWRKSRRAALQGGKTLSDTGLLQKSLSKQVVGSSVFVGSNLAYAGIHQFGGIIKPKNKKKLKFQGTNGENVFATEVKIPARPFIGITNTDKESIAEIIKDFFIGDL